MASELTQELLKELFSYDPETGLFTRKVSRGSRGLKGAIVGCVDAHGYLVTRIEGKLYKNHRLAWLYVNGTHPKDQIDHINGNKLDNRISNLRDVSGSVNQQNRHKAQASSKSGVLGVLAKRGKWVARLKLNGKQHIVGTYETAMQANAAYLTAKRSLHAGCTI